MQLVCLSATLPNVGTVAKWLDASMYEAVYRPVELRHRVCRGRVVYIPGISKSDENEDTSSANGLVKVCQRSPVSICGLFLVFIMAALNVHCETGAFVVFLLLV